MKVLRKFLFVTLLTSFVMSGVVQGGHSGIGIGILGNIDDPIIGHH
ncbi:hypothetical protein HP456_15595 [Bacillus haikouensis]|jgi:hypothetical protein|nr:hypothetical protein [Bacillus haikouensis]NQD67340.1 hypothetical protein [Bacillus haikouensis]